MTIPYKHHYSSSSSLYFFFFFSIIPYDDLTGSNGIPRRRVLKSDYQSNKIYFSLVSCCTSNDNDNDNNDDDKIDGVYDDNDYNYDYEEEKEEELSMNDVVEVRTGMDIDPASPLRALQLAAAAGKYLTVGVRMSATYYLRDVFSVSYT